jgi:hypothetical protein
VTRPPLTLAPSLRHPHAQPSPTLHPPFGRAPARRRYRIETPGLARVIAMPRVIPMSRPNGGDLVEPDVSSDPPEPDPAA